MLLFSGNCKKQAVVSIICIALCIIDDDALICADVCDTC